MTEKRLFGAVKGHREHIADHTGRLYSDSEVADLLNTVYEENEQLKFQLQNTSDQRDEFHRGARENANRVGKLEKENEQLKKENNKLHQKIFEMRTNIALERTEISRQTYTGKKNEKEYLDVKEFLDEIEKW